MQIMCFVGHYVDSSIFAAVYSLILVKEAGDATPAMDNIMLVNRGVASERAFDFVRRWCEECGDSDRTSHQHCPPTESTLIPSRLLRVGAEIHDGSR